MVSTMKSNLFLAFLLVGIVLFSTGCVNEELEEVQSIESSTLSSTEMQKQIDSKVITKGDRIYAATSPKITGSNYALLAIPHYFEYDADENPNGNSWCGQTVLKCVADFHGKYRTLPQLHQTMLRNSSRGYALQHCGSGYCAKLQDLKWAAELSQNNGYGWSQSDFETVYNIGHFFQRMKDGVDYDKPAIVPTTYIYGVGHYYAVTGYMLVRNNGIIDYDNSKLFLRDVVRRTPKNAYYDEDVSVRTFYNSITGNQILFVRP